jgi:hypothetical protein
MITSAAVVEGDLVAVGVGEGGMTRDEQSDAFRILQSMIHSLRDDKGAGALGRGSAGDNPDGPLAGRTASRAADR